MRHEEQKFEAKKKKKDCYCINIDKTTIQRLQKEVFAHFFSTFSGLDLLATSLGSLLSGLVLACCFGVVPVFLITIREKGVLFSL